MGPSQIEIPLTAAEQRLQFAAAFHVLEKAIAEQAFPGASFGVLSANSVVALSGLGHFTYDPGATPVTASTVYDLASLTKVIATTSMAMLLWQRGQLNLEQPLAEILPRFIEGVADRTRSRVTLRMLLAHASGLPGYARLFAQAAGRDDLLQACLDLSLTAEPGIRQEYSDPGFILLGEALATIAGETLESFCTREVFAPLGMTSTCFRPPASWRASIPPTENDADFRHRVVQGEVQDENCFILGGAAGHAGLFSNALDPLRYAQCVLGEREPRLFTPAAIEAFTRRAGLLPGSSRALGWDTPSPPSSSGERFSAHSAGHLGYAGTSLWIDFERKIAIVLLTNRTWPRRESQAIRALRPAFHDCVMEALGAVAEQKGY